MSDDAQQRKNKPDEPSADDLYDQQTEKSISHTRYDANNDDASESDIHLSEIRSKKEDQSNDPMGTATADEPDDIPVASSGEESVSGSSPAPESDDDVGEMMKRYTGNDPDPEMNNPKELGIADEVDEDEEDIRSS